MKQPIPGYTWSMQILADIGGISNDGWTAIAAIAAVGAAVFAWWQGWEARRQANEATCQVNAAKDQVKLMAEQVEVAKEANRLTQLQLIEQKDANTPKLSVKALTRKAGRTWMLEVTVENVGKKIVKVNSVSVLFSVGEPHTFGLIDHGSTKHTVPPEKFHPGDKFVWTFYEPSYRQSGSLETYGPFEFAQQRWRGLVGIEVKASGHVFSADDGDWRRQIVEGWPSQIVTKPTPGAKT